MARSVSKFRHVLSTPNLKITCTNKIKHYDSSTGKNVTVGSVVQDLSGSKSFVFSAAFVNAYALKDTFLADLTIFINKHTTQV